MPEMSASENLISNICEILSAERTEIDGTLYLKSEEQGEIAIQILELNAILAKAILLECDGFNQSSSKYFEVAVRSRTGVLTSMPKKDFMIDDSDHGINYEYGPASNEYIANLLREETSIKAKRLFTRFTHINTEKSIDLFDILRGYFRHYTIKMISTKNRTKDEHLSYLHALLFQVSYNTNMILVPFPEYAVVARNPKFASGRRQAIESIDPPRRLYNKDLFYHYHMATESTSPFATFISFYHILEHFFETVFNDDVVEMVKNKITQPGFSYKRRKDVDGLVRDIKKQFQIKSEVVTFNEQEALKLTLQRFSRIDDLKSRIGEFGPEWIAYYTDNDVEFSKGPKIAFNSNAEETYRTLSKRIYQTRNSLVHSKEGEKLRYTPFIDDVQLQKEIPLLRALSEQVIIENSKILE